MNIDDFKKNENGSIKLTDEEIEQLSPDEFHQVMTHNVQAFVRMIDEKIALVEDDLAREKLGELKKMASGLHLIDWKKLA